MSLSKWLIYPVVSLLVTGSWVAEVIAQTQWIELGRHGRDLVKLNPEIQFIGSAVMYEVLIQLDQPVEGMQTLRSRIIARCESKSQAFRRTDGLDHQGRVVRSNTVADTDLVWRTPENDVYGKAFKMACDSR